MRHLRLALVLAIFASSGLISAPAQASTATTDPCDCTIATDGGIAVVSQTGGALTPTTEYHAWKTVYALDVLRQRLWTWRVDWYWWSDGAHITSAPPADVHQSITTLGGLVGWTWCGEYPEFAYFYDYNNHHNGGHYWSDQGCFKLDYPGRTLQWKFPWGEAIAHYDGANASWGGA